jgi:AraC-like DNA-binding protein
MVAACITEQLTGTTALASPDKKLGLLLRICAFIEGQLGDYELEVSSIAAAHYISVRYLQKLFEEEGQTVTRWIRDRRIEHCRMDLANAALVHMPVSVIAARRGLRSPAHFSRLFKENFGLAPGEYRTHALHHLTAPVQRIESLIDRR